METKKFNTYLDVLKDENTGIKYGTGVNENFIYITSKKLNFDLYIEFEEKEIGYYQNISNDVPGSYHGVSYYVETEKDINFIEIIDEDELSNEQILTIKKII